MNRTYWQRIHLPCEINFWAADLKPEKYNTQCLDTKSQQVGNSQIFEVYGGRALFLIPVQYDQSQDVADDSKGDDDRPQPEVDDGSLQNIWVNVVG